RLDLAAVERQGLLGSLLRLAELALGIRGAARFEQFVGLGALASLFHSSLERVFGHLGVLAGPLVVGTAGQNLPEEGEALLVAPGVEELLAFLEVLFAF